MRPKGFTVVELIVAMSISAVTLLSGYELFQVLKGVGDNQSADLAATAGIVHGLDKIRDDLLHALPRTGSQEPIFVGGNPTLESDAQTAKLLAFYSLCGGHGNGCCSNLRQIHQVSYELVKAEDVIGLYRSAALIIATDQMSTDEDRELILDNIEQIEISFHNGQTLEPSFSSNEELPIGVELSVTAYGQVWPLSVKLPCGAPQG